MPLLGNEVDMLSYDRVFEMSTFRHHWLHMPRFLVWVAHIVGRLSRTGTLAGVPDTPGGDQTLGQSNARKMLPGKDSQNWGSEYP